MSVSVARNVKDSLAIVIPAHNEELRLGPTLREYAESFPRAVIVVVLNGCVDGTEAIVREASQRYPNIQMVNIRGRVGKGGAVRAGFSLTDASLVAFVDADSAFPPSEMRKLLDALADNDAAIASRWLSGSRPLSSLSAARRTAGIGFNLLARLLFGLPFRDTQCGMKLFRRTSLAPLLERIETSNFAFDVDLLYLLRQRRASVVEVPVVWRDVVGSTVSIWRSGCQMAASLVRLRLSHSPLRYLLPLYDAIWPTNPLYFYDQLRILILNWRDIKNPAAGGAEVYLHEMAKRWVQRGHHVEWLTAGFEGSEARVVIDGVTIHRVGNRFSLYLLAPLVYLRSFRNRFHVLVDSENTIPFFSPLFSMKPKVCVMYQVSRRVLALELKGLALAVLTFLEQRVMPMVYRNVPMIAISEDTAADVRSYRIARGPVAIVKSGVQSSLRPGPKAAQATILYLGRLKRFKRVDLLLRALVDIRMSVSDVRLVIAGTGDDETRLRRLTGELGLRNCVTFTGHVDEDEKQRLLQSAWLLVLPSVMEGWGIVVIEANACGTPAIGFNVRGLREVVAHRETGLLVPDGESLAPSIIHVLRDSALRACLEACALEHASRFSWDASASQLLDILKRMASAGPASLARVPAGPGLELTSGHDAREQIYVEKLASVKAGRPSDR